MKAYSVVAAEWTVLVNVDQCQCKAKCFYGKNIMLPHTCPPLLEIVLHLVIVCPYRDLFPSSELADLSVDNFPGGGVNM